jgi:hypothetical protein
MDDDFRSTKCISFEVERPTPRPIEFAFGGGAEEEEEDARRPEPPELARPPPPPPPRRSSSGESSSSPAAPLPALPPAPAPNPSPAARPRPGQARSPAPVLARAIEFRVDFSFDDGGDDDRSPPHSSSSGPPLSPRFADCPFDTPTSLPRHTAEDAGDLYDLPPSDSSDAGRVDDDGVRHVRLIDIAEDITADDAAAAEAPGEGEAEPEQAQSLWNKLFCAFDTADASMDHVKVIVR